MYFHFSESLCYWQKLYYKYINIYIYIYNINIIKSSLCSVLSVHLISTILKSSSQYTTGSIKPCFVWWNCPKIKQYINAENQCLWQIWGDKRDKIWPVMPKYVTCQNPNKLAGSPILWLAQLIMYSARFLDSTVRHCHCDTDRFRIFGETKTEAFGTCFFHSIFDNLLDQDLEGQM